jgi:hypothetical protein
VDVVARESRGQEFEKYRQLLLDTTDRFAKVDEWAADVDDKAAAAKGAIPGKPLSFIARVSRINQRTSGDVESVGVYGLICQRLRCEHG